MDVASIGFHNAELSRGAAELSSAGNSAQQAKQSKTREAFDSFVGETFYGQMLKALRSTVDKPAYFHGGRAEEVFQTQLDQMLSENMSKANAHSFTGPMFEQFQSGLNQLPRK
ncbi:MAG: rod-binding protein [Pirellulales bacterium]